MDNEKLSDAELEIMNVLWKSGIPMRAGEIVKSLMSKHSWKTQTAHALLSRLCAKGYVDADRSGYFHKFYPIVSQNEYIESESFRLWNSVGGSLPAMVATLITADGISEEELEEFTKLIEEKKKQLRNKSDR